MKWVVAWGNRTHWPEDWNSMKVDYMNNIPNGSFKFENVSSNMYLLHFKIRYYLKNGSFIFNENWQTILYNATRLDNYLEEIKGTNYSTVISLLCIVIIFGIIFLIMSILYYRNKML